MKKILIYLGLGLSAISFADDIVDVYGTNAQKSTYLIKTYGKEIQAWDLAMHNTFNDFAKGKTDAKKLQELKEEKNKISRKIKEDGNFLYANLDLVHYIYDKNTYTTIEVIEKANPERLAFVTHKKLKNPEKQYNDIFAKVEEYNNLSLRLKD